MYPSVVYKYQLNDLQTLVPVGKPVFVATQDGKTPTVWVEHQLPLSADTNVYFVIATGEEICVPTVQHVGSVICGDFVWHVYKD